MVSFSSIIITKTTVINNKDMHSESEGDRECGHTIPDRICRYREADSENLSSMMERYGKTKLSSSVERFRKISYSSIKNQRRLTATMESLVKLTLKKHEEPITLQVQNQTHGDLFYRTGRTVSLGNVLKDYCERKGLVYEEMRFIYDGRRVRPTHTPQQLEMEDDFVIDAMSEQIGG